MTKTHAIIYNEYFGIRKEQTEKFGRKTCVLYQVGKFYEIYGTDNNEDIINDIQSIINFVVLLVNPQKEYSKEGNPYRMGVPLGSKERIVDAMIRNGFTVVIYDQKTVEGKIRRVIDKIVSPGVGDNGEGEDKYLISIYVENEDPKDIKISAGVTVVETAIGEVNIFEFYNEEVDCAANKICKNKDVMDEIQRIIEGYNTKEIILYYREGMKEFIHDKFLRYINCDKYYTHIFDKIDNKIYKIEYQKEILSRVYKKIGMLSPHVYCDIHEKQIGSISFISMINFVNSHDSELLNNLKRPNVNVSNGKLILTHDSMEQLNVLSHENKKKSSLCNVIDFTSTAMGKRKLKYNIMNPLRDIEKLNFYYDAISEFDYSSDFSYDIEKLLKQICDISKLHRNLSIGRITPNQFAMLDSTYKSVLEIVSKIKGKSSLEKIINMKRIDKLKTMIDYYNKILDVDKMKSSKFEFNFFRDGFNENIDSIQSKIKISKLRINEITNIIAETIDDKVRARKMKDSGKYVIEMSKKKYQILKNKKDEIENIIGNLIVNSLTSNVKITTSETESLSETIKNSKEEIVGCLKTEFRKATFKIYQKYKKTIKHIEFLISEIDFIKSNAKLSKKYGYCRPVIDTSGTGSSFVVAKKLRHPIIEKINKTTEYIPHDIALGKFKESLLDVLENKIFNNSTNGIFLKGVNSGGKSSLMKSVALAVILAQAGCFVPAESFVYFPFSNIITRISSNDDIRREYGSFEVEASEMRTMLRMGSENSLIVGDELCRATEMISGTCIVTSISEKLASKCVNFIFTTHLMELETLLKNKTNIQFYHFKTTNKNGTIVYDRKLMPGSGSYLYGIEVAKAVKLDYDVIERAFEIRNTLLNKLTFSDFKPSHYNTSLYTLTCSVCNKKCDDVHHINEQHDANSFGLVKHFHKNSKHNLVPLCKSCHNKAHTGEINIHGYVKTSDGVSLSVDV